MERQCYLHNFSAAEGTSLLAGIHALVPEARSRLCLGARSALAWSRRRRSIAGDPIPEEVVFRLVERLFKMGEVTAGVLVTLAQAS